MKVRLLGTTLGLLIAVATSSSAAVVTLRSGEKVEGVFQGASPSVVMLTVGTRAAEFPMAEVLSIAFDEAAPSRAAVPTGLSQAGAADDAGALLVKEARGLVADAQEGLALEAYRARLDSLRESLARFAQERGQGYPAGFRDGVSDAVGYLTLAAAVWDAKLTRKGREALSADPYLDRCAATDADLETVVRPGDDALKRGVGAAVVGPRPFWACAETAAAAAGALLPR